MPASVQGQTRERPPSAKRVVLANGEIVAEREFLASDTQIDNLHLLSSARLSGFAAIRKVQRVPRGVRVRESYLQGFSLEHARTAVRSLITVNLALAFVLDLARALHRLHDLAEPETLVHGSVGLKKVMLTRDGRVWLVGLRGQTGDQQKDIDALMGLMRTLLSSRAENPQGAALLDKLGNLRFPTAKALAISVEAYLSRQDAGVLAQRRHRFVEQVGRLVRDPLMPVADEAPTELQPMLPPDLGVDDSERPWQELLEESLTGLAEEATNEEVPNPIREITQEEEVGSWQTELKTEIADAEADIDLDIDIDIDIDEDVKDALLQAVAATPAKEPPPTPELPDDDDAPKSVDVGDYRVVASIGRGGMGEIYLGRAIRGPRLGELAALKVLAGNSEEDVDALDMLLDEARILAHIQHPGVLKVLDFGRAHGKYFLASEYLEGRPLVRVMIKAYGAEGGLEHGVVAALGSLAAEGLYAAHTARLPDGTPLEVVHRDVSPQNIFVTYSGEAKVIDFGVARAVERVSKTQAGLVKGKAAYMSPEQVEGQATDARSDVFSLGICLWEMVAGRRLFKQDQEYDTLLAVQTLPIEPPSIVRGMPSPVLDHIIMKALERAPDKRTPTARALAQELEDYSRSQGITDRQQAIGLLLHRLFSEEAEGERALIKQLEQRAATQAEIDKLRELSGVAQVGVGGRMTWVAEPGGLDAMDDYGRDAPKERVLEAVQKVDRERQRTPTANPLIEDRTLPLLVASELPPEDSDDQFVILVPEADQTTPSAPVPEKRSGVGGILAVVFIIGLIGAAVYGWFAFGEQFGLREPSSPEASLVVADPTALEKLPNSESLVAASTISKGADEPQEELTEPEVAEPVALVLNQTDGTEPDAAEAPVVAAAMELTAPPPLKPAPTQVEPVALDAVIDQPTDATDEDAERLAAEAAQAEKEKQAAVAEKQAALAEKQAEARRKAATELAETKARKAAKKAKAAEKAKAADKAGVVADDKQPVDDKPAVDNPPASRKPPGDKPSGFSSGRPDRLFAELKAHGFSITKSRATYLLSDGRGGSLAVHKTARMTGRNGAFKGWVVDNKKNRLTTVGIVGLDQSGRPRVRGVTINDCPASVEVAPSRLQISYGAQSQSLPNDGGALIDVRIDAPEGTTGVVLEPLNLAFGDTAGAGISCRTGWWGRRVVVRRVPPGRYQLRWVGADAATTELVVAPGSVQGGQHVRTRSFQ